MSARCCSRLAIVAGLALVEAAEAIVYVFGALLLTFVAIKILIADLVHVSDLASLAFIAVLLGGGIVASLVADRLDPVHPAEEATRRPPRCPPVLTPATPPARPD